MVRASRSGARAAVQLALLAALVGAYLYVMWRTPADPPPPRRGLAVAQERLRFARDLHDLLGHSLSVIALKSELAEVREAVGGYRHVTLAAELGGLSAAIRKMGARSRLEALRTAEDKGWL